MLRRAERGHAEAFVGRKPPRAADVRERAVEHHVPPLVGVEAVVDEMVHEPAGLRDAEDVGALDGSRQRVRRAGAVGGFAAEE